MREYLQKKRGIANPTGPLLKAALVHSAVPLSGNVAKSVTETDVISVSSLGSPNSYEGHGKVYLGGLLNTEDGSSVDLRIFEKSFNSTKQPLQLCFKKLTSTASIPVKATLVWYDYPSSPSTIPTLVNDLNLFINDCTGTKCSVIGGNMKQTVDTVNTVEKISFSAVGGYTSVAVYITSLGFNLTQPYALLVSFPQGSYDVTSNDQCSFSTSINFSNTTTGGLDLVAIGIGIALCLIFVIIVIGSLITLAFLIRRILLRRRAPRRISTKFDDFSSDHPYYMRHLEESLF